MARYFATLLFVLLIGRDMLLTEAYEPVSFFLAWQRLPNTTMTVRFITKDDRASDTIEWREKGTSAWESATGRHIRMPQKLPYFIHFVELTSLKPGQAYEFRFSDEGKVYFFRTAPSHLTRTLRFAVGGDMYHDGIEDLKETMSQAAAQDPLFVVAGGDLAYAAPVVSLFGEDAKRWFTWLKAWQETMVAPDGRIIPVVPVIGNHEVIGRYLQTRDQAEFYYSLFATPGPRTNYVLDFGDYMSFIVLDSGHTQSIEGEQAKWLQDTLLKRGGVPNKFAAYHVPAYPSVRKYEGKVTTKVRETWVPYFEAASLNAAFEHHDHAYKRTHPIFKGKIDEERGVLFLGDGAFGIKEPRQPKDLDSKWYLVKALPERHFILVSLKGRVRQYQAINYKGTIIDSTLR